MGQTELVHLALAEPNSKHRGRQGRETGCFIPAGAIRVDGKLMLKSLNSPMTCRLQILRGAFPEHCGLGVQGLDGS